MPEETETSKQRTEQFQKYLDRFRKSNGQRLSKNTIESYVRVIARLNDDFDLDAPDEHLVEQCNKFIDNYYCAITYYALRMYLIYHVKHSVIPLLTKPPTHSLTEQELHELILSREELMLMADHSPFVRLIIYLFYDTAMRREAMMFKVKDIQYSKNRIRIHEKEQTVALVDIHTPTMELLKEHTKGMLPNEVALNMSSRTIARRLNEAGMKTIFKRVHPHQIRHSVLQHLADDETDWIELMHFARHSSPNTTKKYIAMAGHMRRKVFKEKHNHLEVIS